MALELPKLYLNELSEANLDSGNGITVLGDSSVGKTFEILRAIRGVGLSIDTRSTDEADLLTVRYPMSVEVPLDGYENCEIVYNRRGTLTKAQASIRDLAGQYKGEEATIRTKMLNTMLIDNAKVIEMIADTTRPETLNSLIENWIPMIDDARGIENAVISIYFSKAAIGKADFDVIKLGDYETLLETFPETTKLIETMEGKKHKTMTFIGDMDVTINGQEHQTEVYLLRTNEWVEDPISVPVKGPKALPFMKYFNDQGQLSDGMQELVSAIEMNYGKIISY